MAEGETGSVRPVYGEGGRELSINDVAKVLKALENVINDWYTLGTYLEVAANELAAIQEENHTIRTRLIKMLEQWLRSGQECSWRKLVEALYLMGEIVVAEAIRRKYLSVTTQVLPKYLSKHDAYTVDPKTRTLLVKKNKQHLASKFSALVKRLSTRMTELKIDFVLLQTYLTTFGSDYKCFVDDIQLQDTLLQLFNVVSRHKLWDYFNFDLASYMVKEFAEDDQKCQELLVGYRQDFTGYLLTTKIVDHIAALCGERGDGSTATTPESISSEELCSKLTVKLAIDVTTHSLKYVEEVWETLLRYSQLPKHTLLLREISESSLIITWFFPKKKTIEVATAILQNADQLKLKQVVLVTIDGIDLSIEDQLVTTSVDSDKLMEKPPPTPNIPLPLRVALKLKNLGDGLDEEQRQQIQRAMLEELQMRSAVKSFFSSFLEYAKAVLTTIVPTEPAGVMLVNAAREGNVDLVASLLNQGANVNSSKDKQGRTPLVAGCVGGSTDTIKLLITRGADINLRTEVTAETVSLTFTPLCAALMKGHEKVAILLIEHGADVNAVGMEGKTGSNTHFATPLMAAAMIGLLHAIKLLLQRGAEVDKEVEWNIKGKTQSFTALMEAANVEVAKLLLEYGAQVNFQASRGGGTALIRASYYGLYEVAELLLERGGEVDLQDSEGKSALMWAIMKNDQVEVKDSARLATLLLQHGANPKLEDGSGDTALSIATKQGDEGLIKLLTASTSSEATV